MPSTVRFSSCAGSNDDDGGGGPSCPWKLDRYEPSDWEKEWVDGGEDLQNIVCQARSLAAGSQWVSYDSCVQRAVTRTACCHCHTLNAIRCVHMRAKPSLTCPSAAAEHGMLTIAQT